MQKPIDLRALPADLSAVNLRAYLGHAFGLCGCSELDAVHATLLRLLEWHANKDKPMYDTLYSEPGVFYILAGLLESLDYRSRLDLPDDGVGFLRVKRLQSADQRRRRPAGLHQIRPRPALAATSGV